MDMLMRDKAGKRIHAGKVVREVEESFLSDKLSYPFKPFVGYGLYAKMTISKPTGSGEHKISQRNSAIGGTKYTYSVEVQGTKTGDTIFTLECSFRDSAGVEVGTRQTKNIELKNYSETHILADVTIPTDAVTTDVLIGMKTTVGGTANMYIHKIRVIESYTGKDIVRNGDFTNGINNWSVYKSTDGTLTVSQTYKKPNFTTNYGYAVFTSEPMGGLLGGLMVDVPFVPKNLREINWEIEGVSMLDSEPCDSFFALKNNENTAGFAFTQVYGEETAKLYIYKQDGTYTTISTKYNMDYYNERFRRKNLTLTLFPQSKMIYIMEGDQVVYYGKHEDLIIDKSVNAILYANNRSTLVRPILVSKAKLQLIHN